MSLSPAGLTGSDTFGVIEAIFCRRVQFFAEISQGIGLGPKIRAMLLVSIGCTAAYGALLGVTHSLEQTLSGVFKLPLLFLVTLIVCAPALYIINMLFSTNQSLRQSLALVLTVMTATAVLLISFGPVTLFFIVSTVSSAGQYQLFKLLNVGFFTIAGGTGAWLLGQGLQVVSAEAGVGNRAAIGRIFFVWAVLYVFVGSQVAWTLRPFIGRPGMPFELFRQLGGNFYADILASAGEILGFIIVQ